MNCFVGYGRLVRDVELKYSPSGAAVGKFTLAINRSYQKGEKKTDFLNMTAFGKTAETISGYFHQGSRIVVQCHAQQEEYTKQDGTKVNTVGFIVDGFSFVNTRAENGIAQNQSTQQIPPPAPNDGFMTIPDGIDSELPFD